MSAIALLGAQAMMKARKAYCLFRSAITGMFVSQRFARANPDTTIRQRIGRKKRKRKARRR
jgi:hypothetical protein